MGLKEAIAKYRTKKQKVRARETEIKQIHIKALQQERIKQVRILATQQAKIEREEKIKRIKQQARTGASGGILGSISKRINIAAENLGYGGRGVLSELGTIPTPRISKKGKAGPQVITVKGKKFQIMKTKKKKKRRTPKPQVQQGYNPFETSF